MILIEKNANNLITLTLNEKTTLTAPVYLFKFRNDTTHQTVRFIATNLTSYSYRYDQFLVTETSGSTNLTSGVIHLAPTGFWSYEIFEQESITNLDENNTIGLVESGIVKVTGNGRTDVPYDNTKTYIAYGTGAS